MCFIGSQAADGSLFRADCILAALLGFWRYVEHLRLVLVTFVLKVTVYAYDAILFDKFLLFREGCFNQNFFIGVSIHVFRIVLGFG